jgi:hypothetical protein
MAWWVRAGSSTGEATFWSQLVLCDSLSNLIDLFVESRGKLRHKLIQFGGFLRHDCLSAELAYAIFQTPGLEMPGYKTAQQAPRRFLRVFHCELRM